MESLKNVSTMQKEKLENVFFCKKSKSFINSIYICDGIFDCPFWEDEKYCKIKTDEEFFCISTNKTINYKLICNHIKDCENGEDENFCGEHLNFL